MQTLRIDLQTRVTAKLSDELRKKLYYVSPEIVGFELIQDGSEISGVDLTLSEPVEAQQLGSKINSLIETELRTQRAMEPRVIWRSPHSLDRYHPDMFQQLLDDDMVFEAGSGLVSLASPLIKLMDYLDERIREFTKREFGAEEYRYPTLIQTKTLDKVGYFASFPQLIMFVTYLHNDMDVYRAFVEDYNETCSLTSSVFGSCRSHEHCLPPTMCYHTYNQLQGTTLGAHRVITARGKSFRFESRYSRGLERLWDFTIREIVFLGDRSFALAQRQAFMERTQTFVEELGLCGHYEVANDPFFVGQDTTAMIFSQQMKELKYELRLDIDSDTTIAAASFNFHEEFFGKSFDIDNADGSTIVTGCVGFGLERLTYAFCCQHGHKPSGWPEAVRRAIEEMP
ncbi:MAG: hypothetical protein AAF968_14710 [Pseudomonadota bacterium]